MKQSQFVVLICLAVYIEAKRYCMNDDDCDHLGKLICVKSACQWGTCGCPPGRTARFLGSRRRFGCVPNKKVGEKCSDNDGVCLAPNSFCDKESQRCRCLDNYAPAWGGEACISTASSDTCHSQARLAPLRSNCNPGATGPCFINSLSNVHSALLPLGPAMCACSNEQILDFEMIHGSTSYWFAPFCRPLRIGDTCLHDNDCPSSGFTSVALGGKCTSNRCVCETNYVPNYDGSACKRPLAFNDVCRSTTSSIDQHCDGTLGLVCGDWCDVPEYSKPNTGSNVRRCTCGAHHKTSGSTCSKILEGGSCYGDFNCKGFSPLGVCVEGTCRNGSRRMVATASLSISLLTMALFLIL